MDSFSIPPDCAPLLERIGEEFLASIYHAATLRQPHNVEALAELGHIYTRLGRYQDGLEVDLKLVGHEPLDPLVRYNLACSQALVGLPDEACASLETAIELGYSDVSFMTEDEDLSSLRGFPRFEAILSRIGTAEK